MKILTSLSQNYKKVLNDCFLPTLPPNTDLVIQYINYSFNPIFGSQETTHKFPLVLGEMNNSKKGDILWYCDVDIIFMRQDIKNIVQKLFDDNPEVDMFVQQDNDSGGLCLGCFAVRNVESSEKIIRKYLEADIVWIQKNYTYSLNYFKHLVDTTGYNCKQFPLNFYAGHLNQFNIKEPEELYLYHATNCSSGWDVNGKYNSLIQRMKK